MCQMNSSSSSSSPAPATAAAPTCECGGHEAPAHGPGRVVPARHELEMPEVPFASRRVLEVAGDAGLRELTRRHHELLRASEIGHLFTADDLAFAALIERVADYVVETCGGPALFTPTHGDTCMRVRHFPFTIDERGREVWLEMLFQAMGETAFPVEIREEYWAWMEPFSLRMINRRTTKTQPVRLPYALACIRFGAAGRP